MLEVIFLNTGEFILFLVIFGFLGKMTEFFVATGILMGLRTFAGGFHLEKFRYCVILSLAIFWAVIMISPTIDITQGILEILLGLSLLINIIFAPVSKRRSGQSPKAKLLFKGISTVIVLVFSYFILKHQNSPLASIAAWTIFIQSVQLIIGKVLLTKDKTRGISRKRLLR